MFEQLKSVTFRNVQEQLVMFRNKEKYFDLSKMKFNVQNQLKHFQKL